MIKKAVFHIGYPKTGTTTLQHFLADNVKALKDYGYYYAERTYNGHVGNADNIYIAGLPGFDPAVLKQIFDEDVKRSNGQTILYSHEILFNLEDKFYAVLADYFDEVKIVIYLRRQDKWLESYKRWQIAAGVPMKESKWDVPYCLTDYHKAIKKIAKQLGEESILIRPFERKQFYKENINYDFLLALDIAPEAFDAFNHSTEVLNISMNGKALVFKKLLNRYLPNRTYRIKNTKDIFGFWRGTHINKALGTYPISEADKGFQVMNYKEKIAVMKDTQAGNKAIENQFFNAQPLYNDTPPSDSIVSYDDLKVADIKEVAAFAFESLMEKTAGVSKEYLIASVANALDSFDEYDRYAKLFMDDYTLIKQSGWFDEAFYFGTNPVLQKGTDAILHYLMMGHKQNLDPCEKFSTEQYKLSYPEACDYDMCPLVHYLRFGKAEGNKPTKSRLPKEKGALEKLAVKLKNKLF